MTTTTITSNRELSITLGDIGEEQEEIEIEPIEAPIEYPAPAGAPA